MQPLDRKVFIVVDFDDFYCFDFIFCCCCFSTVCLPECTIWVVNKRLHFFVFIFWKKKWKKEKLEIRQYSEINIRIFDKIWLIRDYLQMTSYKFVQSYYSLYPLSQLSMAYSWYTLDTKSLPSSLHDVNNECSLIGYSWKIIGLNDHPKTGRGSQAV